MVIVEYLIGKMEQLFTLFCQLEAVPDFLEQLDAEFFLHFFELNGDVGLGIAQFLCGL